MSKISLEPNDSGAGTFSIVSPDSNTNRTLNLPDESGTVATIENIPPGYEDQDALDLFNVTGSAPVFACRAWGYVRGNGSIDNSGNVSSITDLGTGQYQVNFATNLSTNRYGIATYGGVSNGVGANFTIQYLNTRDYSEPSDSGFMIQTQDTGGVDVPTFFTFIVTSS